MPKNKRHKTKYPGVYFILGNKIGSNKKERIYYITYLKDGRVIEEKAGRQFSDDMTPARAAGIRAEKIDGRKLSNKERREAEQAKKQLEKKRWTIDRLWKAYKKDNPHLKGWRTYNYQYKKYLKPTFANKEPKDILQLDVDRLRLRLLKKLTPQSVKHELALLRRIINFGVTKGHCKGLDFTIKMPVVHNLVTEDLTQEQLQNLLDAIDKDDHAQAGPMMKMALFTGMRRGEMFRLKWKDINLERGFINIRDPKGGPDQKIPLNEATRELLANHPKTSDYVFPGRGGRQRINIGKQVRRIADVAELPANFRPLHGLRHVYASMLASSGKVDMYVLQKLLTHKDQLMTQRYAHLRDETLKRASDLAGDIITDALKKKSKVVNLNDHKEE